MNRQSILPVIHFSLFVGIFSSMNLSADDPAQLPSIGEPGVMSSLDYGRVIPPFPTVVDSHTLKSTTKNSTVRLFEGGNWQILDPAFTDLSMSCSGRLWLIHWQSTNPDVLIDASFGLNDGGSYSPVVESAHGGAGWFALHSCVAPALKFAKAINGNKSTLVDVEFQYQVWEAR